MAFFDFFKPLMVKAPELAYFDHLHGEYEALKASPSAEPESARRRALFEKAEQAEGDRRGLLDDFRAKRAEGTISWQDLYLFELLLSDLRPVGALRGKVLSLRRDYRSVVGQVEYDEYLASKPKNLLDPPDPRDPPEEDADYEKLLRDDLKDLLGRLFKRYGLLPVREARLKRLTIYAALFCALFLFILLAFVVSMGIEDFRSGGDAGGARSAANVTNANANGANVNANAAAVSPEAAAAGTRSRQTPLPSIPLFVVLFSGAMGGFVSALQRIQRSPTEGDSVYNLAMLYHGSYAVFVAPLTGAIFSILLYMMFTGNILEGRFFPNIYTPAARTVPAQMGEAGETPTPTPPAANANANANANASAANANRAPAPRRVKGRNATTANAAAVVNANANNGNTNSANANDANANTANVNANAAAAARAEAEEDAERDEAAAVPTPTPASVPTASLSVRDFLYRSGPAGGEDYALLIIWSFIAGFAERFVPDSLNRLINK